MWELNIQTIGLVVVLIAAVIQICLELFWRERTDWLRFIWVCILALLIVAGAIANYIGTRKSQSELHEEQERTSQLESELQGLRQYSKVAKYNALGLTGIAGAGIKENSPINQALEGAYIEEETQTGSVYHPRCDDQGIARFEIVAREFPNFPFSYWALAKCLKQMGDSQWRAYGERAMSIFQHTTLISERSPHHDQARKQMEELLVEQ